MKKIKNFSHIKKESLINNFNNDIEIFDDDFTNNREENKIENTQIDSFDDDSKVDYNTHSQEKNDDNNKNDIELFKNNHDNKDEYIYTRRRRASHFSQQQIEPTHVYHQSERSQGDSIMFAIATIMLIGIGLPILSIFYFNAPKLDQHSFVLGLSYFKILFLFFITSAIIVYTALFFLRSSQFAIISIFLLSLFCCFPFIAGIRNNLTMTQAILELKLFYNWPFFLKPAYIFFQILLPFGIIIYIILQIKNLLGKQKHSYVYIFIAIYLSISAIIGFSILNKANQPNIVSYILSHISSMDFINISLRFFEIDNKISNSKIAQTPIVEQRPDFLTNTQFSNFESSTYQPSHLPYQPQYLPYLEQDIDKLRIKSKNLLELISTIESVLATKYQVMKDEQNFKELKTELNKTGNMKTKDMSLEEIEKEIEKISAKLDILLKAIAQDKRK